MYIISKRKFTMDPTLPFILTRKKGGTSNANANQQSKYNIEDNRVCAAP